MLWGIENLELTIDEHEMNFLLRRRDKSIDCKMDQCTENYPNGKPIGGCGHRFLILFDSDYEKKPEYCPFCGKRIEHRMWTG